MTVSYQVLGVSVPSFLGRENLLKNLERQLLKPTPDHVCVVGPARYGKSVLLHHLTQKYRQGNESYTTAVYLDLRHSPPSTDEEFKQRLARELKMTLSEIGSDLAAYLEPDENSSIYELLDLVFEELDGQGDRLLVILDGFDHVLKEAGITRNLWDQLRNLAQHGSLRLVTGSRLHLRHLRNYMPTDSRVSDFWEIFNPIPLSVNKLEDSDWDGFFLPLRERDIKLDSSACKEISNWTGGVPILAAALLKELAEQSEQGSSLSKSDIDSIAKRMVSSHCNLLEELWDDCTDEMKGDLVRTAAADVDANSLPHERKTTLLQRGFLQLTGNKLKSSCRLMQEYAELRAPSVKELNRLFADVNGFETNIKTALELRFLQLPPIDSILANYIRESIHNISPSPIKAIYCMRDIAERGLDLIWQKELPPDRSIPTGWIAEWRSSREWREDLLDSSGRLPHGNGDQCNILRIATGTLKSRPVTRYVTKSTYVLLNHIKVVGDFRSHFKPNQDFISIGTAASFCMSAIALCESLHNDLNRT